MTKYLHQFNQLARYAPQDIDTEAKKMEKFSEGLQESLKFHISALDFIDLASMVNKLLILEETRGEMEETRKIKIKQMVPSTSALRGRMMPPPSFRF